MSEYGISASPLPDIDSLWDYGDPAASEIRFREVLERAEWIGNEDYRAQLLTQIARTQILQRKYDAGRASLATVACFLPNAKVPATRIRYLLEQGRAWNDTGLSADASAAFEEAFHLACPANLDALSVDAAHMLGLMPPDDAAIHWNQAALKIAEASTEPRARRWTGTLFMNLGCVLQRLGDCIEAGRAFSSALSAFEAAGHPSRARLARLCLSKNLRLLGDAKGALPLQEQLLAEGEAAGEPVGFTLEEIAESLFALGRSGEAQAMFARAYEILSVYPWFPPNEPARLERMRLLGRK